MSNADLRIGSSELWLQNNPKGLEHVLVSDSWVTAVLCPYKKIKYIFFVASLVYE